MSPENTGPRGWRSSTEQPPATLVLDVRNLKEQAGPSEALFINPACSVNTQISSLYSFTIDGSYREHLSSLRKVNTFQETLGLESFSSVIGNDANA